MTRFLFIFLTCTTLFAQRTPFFINSTVVNNPNFTNTPSLTFSAGLDGKIAADVGPTVTAAIKAKGPLYDITAYGANGSGTTTTVSSWTDATHVVVASSNSFVVGDAIGILRAGALDTTGTTTAGGTTITSVANTNGFAIGDDIRVIGGQAAQAMVRQITVQVAGNEGELTTARINGTNYTYTVGAAATVNSVATGLGAAITGDSSVVVSVLANVISITAATPGVLFTYENVRPTIGTTIALTPRTKLTYQTTAANIPTSDFVTRITGVTATTITVNVGIPSAVTGARIEKRFNRLITTISGISGTTLTLAASATSQPIGSTAIVYHNTRPYMVLAIAAAAAGGGNIFLPPGTYYMPDNFNAVSFGNVGIIGAGMGKSMLKSGPDWQGSGLYTWHTSDNNASNIVIKDLTIDLGCPSTAYTGRTGIGIQIGGSAVNNNTNWNILIENVEIQNTAGNGIVVYNARNAIVKDCKFHDIGVDGVMFRLFDNGSTITDSNSQNIWVVNNSFERIGFIAALTYGDSSRGQLGHFQRVHVMGNSFRHCCLLGWEFYSGSTDSEMVGNSAEYCGAYASIYSLGDGFHGGYTIKHSQNIAVTGNVVRNSYNGFEIESTTMPGTNGYATTRNIILNGNIITDCQRDGIDMTYFSDNVTLENNSIDTVSADGISIGANSNTTDIEARNTYVINNVIRSAQRGIRISQGVSNLEIRGNTIDSCNTFESSLGATDVSAISLNPLGAGSFTNSNIWIIQNNIVENRTTPAFGQRYPLFVKYSTVSGAVLNRAFNNQTNSYVLSTNGTVSLSTQNTWDAEGYAIENTTGTGVIVRSNSPAIVTPTIASFVNATHTHQNSAGGGTLDGSVIAAGTISKARGGTGADNSSVTFPSSGTIPTTSDKLSVFSSTTSAELAGVISNETGSGLLTFATSPALVAPTVTGRTWATVGATTPTAGTLDYVTDIGSGTYMVYNGTRWKPLNSRANIAKAVAVASIANSETIVMQTLIPAALMATNDGIRIHLALKKSGTTDTLRVWVHWGTAGTTADTAVSVNNSTLAAAASRTWTGFMDFNLATQTSAFKVGGGAVVSTGLGETTSAALTPVTISSASANAIYISVGIASSSTNDTVGIDSGEIEFITP